MTQRCPGGNNSENRHLLLFGSVETGLVPSTTWRSLWHRQAKSVLLGDRCQTSLTARLLTLAEQASTFRAFGAVFRYFTPDSVGTTSQEQTHDKNHISDHFRSCLCLLRMHSAPLSPSCKFPRWKEGAAPQGQYRARLASRASSRERQLWPRPAKGSP